MWAVVERLTGKRSEIQLQEFAQEFLSICEAHRAQGRAALFAFILYDYTQPQLRQVLSQRSYWQSLDELSGQQLTVFVFHTPLRRRQTYRGRRPDRSAFRDLYLAPDSIISQHFGNELDLKPPCVLFFQVDQGQISDSFQVSLKERKIEDAYWELHDVLNRGVGSLDRVEWPSEPSAQDVFNLAKQALRDRTSGSNLLQFGRLVDKGLRAAVLIERVRGFLVG